MIIRTTCIKCRSINIVNDNEYSEAYRCHTCMNVDFVSRNSMFNYMSRTKMEESAAINDLISGKVYTTDGMRDS